MAKASTPGESKQYRFRGLSFRSGSVWVAACLDLDIFAQADSESEALEKLLDQSTSYVHSVVERGFRVTRIPRRAPVRYWIMWYRARIASAFQSLVDGRRRRNAYILCGPVHGRMRVA